MHVLIFVVVVVVVVVGVARKGSRKCLHETHPFRPRIIDISGHVTKHQKLKVRYLSLCKFLMLFF